MPISIRDSGVWKEPEMLSVKDAGVWKGLSGGAGMIAPGMRAEGGFVVGFFTLDFTDAYALILADKSSEATREYKTVASETVGTIDLIDGWTNSNNMNNASHPAAFYCRSYTGGGFDDWYLPARYELEMCYRALKPGTQNNGSFPKNPNSLPAGFAYITSNPGQTQYTDYMALGDEAFDEGVYWTSSADPSIHTHAYTQNFSNAVGNAMNKTSELLVRPVRRVKIY